MSVLIAASMVFSLTACVGLGGDVTSEENNSAVDSDTISVGFVQVGHESDWRVASTESCQNTFSEENGYELFFVDCDDDEAKQLDAVRSFIEQKLDYIIIDPIVTTGWDKVLQEAKDAGIPVIIIDREIDADESLYTAWVGSDFQAEGDAAGAWLQAYLEAKGRGDDDINIVTIAGTTGASAQIGRTNGFNAYVDANENWTLLDEQDGNFTQQGGQKVMESFLKSYDDIDVVVCQNDNEAFGAIDALNAAGKTFGREGDIIIISFDCVNAGILNILDGKITADFECNPLAAPYVEDIIKTIERGEEITEKHIYMDEACFACDDTVVSFTTLDGLEREMTVVTEDILAERVY